MKDIVDEWAAATGAGLIMAVTVLAISALYILSSTAWSILFG